MNYISSDKENSIISIAVFGVFFISYATNAFIIAGSLGKYFCLGFGFLLMIYSYLKTPKDQKTLRFFGMSILIYLFYFLLGIINEQRIFSITNVFFGMVCFVLLNIGYVLGRSQFSYQLERDIRNAWIIPFLTIMGVVFLIKFQTQLVLGVGENTRGYGEDSDLNPVGVAYVHGLLFLINYSIYQKTSQIKLVYKVLLIIAQIATIIAMITTLSRGALLFLGIFIFMYYLSQLKLDFRLLKNLFKILIMAVAVLIIISIIADFVPILQEKIDGIMGRFTGLFSFLDNTSRDASSEERLEGYMYFYENLNEVILIGLKNYHPYPHNQYIEIIMRWGIMGLPFLIFSVFCILKGLRCLKNYAQENNVVFLLIISVFIFSYFQSMTSLSLEMNRLMWLGMGFVYGLPKFNHENLYTNNSLLASS